MRACGMQIKESLHASSGHFRQFLTLSVIDVWTTYGIHLTIYPKNRKDTLTDAELAELRDAVKEIRHG
jgi:hypothetical protein